MAELDTKIEQAVKLLQVFGRGKVVEVCFSGGKDSEVILELAKMAGINYRAIYKAIGEKGTLLRDQSFSRDLLNALITTYKTTPIVERWKSLGMCIT